MSTATLLRDYSASTTILAQRAGLELLAAWGTVGSFTDVATVRALIGPTYYALITQYGSAAAALASVVAEEVLKVAAPPVAATGTLAAAEGSLRWSMGPLYGNLAKIRPDDALSLLDGTLTRHVLTPGRETMTAAAESAGVRFKRVLSGTAPCDFCRMLAGRDAVYRSDRSAGLFTKFHDACRCDVVPDV